MHNSRDDNFKISSWLHVALLLLSAIAGSIDAIGYLKLGDVLTANMTGNTVLMGVSLGQWQLSHAVREFVALLAFITGVGIGSSIAKFRRKGWEQTLIFSLIIEFFLILIMAILWLAFMKNFHGFMIFGSIIACAVAMGLQSATVKHLEIPGVVTTYITGTITAIVSEFVGSFQKSVQSAGRPHEWMPPVLEKRFGLQAGVFLVYLFTAAITAVIYKDGIQFLPLLPLVLILTVILLVAGKLNIPER